MIINDFIGAINDTRLVELTFDSKSKGIITRTYAPMDYAPSRRSSSPELKLHFYDTHSGHPVPLTENQIITLRILEAKFSPENIVTWTPNWYTSRDWGSKS